jgi:hypothetical protein
MNDKRRFSLFPKTLSQIIEPLTRPVFKAQGIATTRLVTEWEQIVGTKLAQHSLPQKLSFPAGKTVGGTLTVAVSNGFATEMQHMQPVILDRLGTYFGYKAVERITISHTYQPAPKPKPAAPKPAKAALPAGSEKLADEVTDPELKQALQSFAKTLSKNL